MNKTGKTILIFVVFFISIAFLSLNAYSDVSMISGPEAISTANDEETSTVAVDIEGNAHIVWASAEGTYLFYKMVDKDGNVLIGETNLTPCTNADYYHVRRPSIVLDPSGGLHIIFHGFSLYTGLGDTEYSSRTDLDSSEVIYTKINPYNYLAGSKSGINDLIVIPETIISTDNGTKSRAPNLAMDYLNNRLHIVWFEGNDISSLSIIYLVLDLDGGTVVSETTLSSDVQVDIDWGEPEIVVDPDGNAHIVYCTGEFEGDDREIYYTMVSGNTGQTLIDDTMITELDGHASVRAHLAVDLQGMVHVVWHDKRLSDAGTGEHEIFYSKLDPSKDDQNGDAADPEVISDIS